MNDSEVIYIFIFLATGMGGVAWGIWIALELVRIRQALQRLSPPPGKRYFVPEGIPQGPSSEPAGEESGEDQRPA